MNPIAFTILGLSIRWYGILIACGMLIAIIIARFTSKIKDVNYDELFNIILISLPLAVIGARLYYVIFNFNYYENNLIEIFNTRQGGLAIHGGVITGLITAYLYTYYKKLNFWKFADVATPSIILAQAIGRWGNFFNQEAHGGPVSYDFIKHFPNFIQNGMYINGIYYHPTFLYESIWNLFVFLILLILLKNTKKTGLVIFTYIGLYSIGRFFIEGLRTDSLMLGSIRVAQLISLIGIIIWIIFLLITYKKNNIFK
ncbi:prolipoprotein diacylglyceryl transferase [Clostridium pasteurianum DSM 525 = ATCC 6013]|uniref:Phosphatidylglycerol--prolipoprotein diacylglyceryl transferase n=1 Tax=Clostridium pasteurianum DSM 525 = ATCC 6013 TaxID=1262449 RepID=A0A0H3IYT3_CLOPA|nr:prolipoprotein diacylglyceryl transferase [Clostridium pasteurianum]AJA46169.1 prolipoprotein diacylglyceryl transferase [Clostridium pasteurianum DSM 525 = ATCC 6013]AJA50157.1 prolipoprotein diacylglyceryl transferase [Clostridium pasteurianum DSM 525 = ATCC 6013]AOZ73629.1 prolipoprotein diacylglyceryl transferase [Clostridium pasteurianum DSM 525 = ATCC 6013]AOZ77426.1 prolipoprotein diacylglyceryl transferase [Clostridium pasteurianum]ELP57759.1 prolipoprotein diacylglyceryl transferas